MTTTDVLILGVARQSGGLMIAGMTTERDPVTRLRWMRLAPSDVPLEPDELRYADGSLVRLGDVVRLELGAGRPQPPHVESVDLDLSSGQIERVRRLQGERRVAFFAEHLDPDPADVLRNKARSLCLVRPDHLYAIASFDEETGKFEARLALHIGRLRSNEEGILVGDIYWRALMRAWLGENEYLEFDDEQLRAELGEIYVVIALGRKAPVVIGVHTVPEYDVTLDESAL
ncbi:MAG TPA: hypothetical protein VLA19_20010 [Herpetosiphonaceae bacterium]|nr:hypothetical protein [Herpetosiphonaceae bacterium]